MLPGAALRGLADAAAAYGDGNLWLTSRGNLQMRGVTTDRDAHAVPGLIDAVAAAGLLPAPGHERVRNITASPLSGLAGGLDDVRPVVRRLDELLCADPDLAALPGRFLFTLDDGRGDMATLASDLGAVVVDDSLARVVIGHGFAGPIVPLSFVAQVLVTLAARFLEIREDAWHVRDLPVSGAELVEGVPDLVERPAPVPMPYGAVTQDDGRRAVSALAPLGRLEQRQLAELVAAAERGTGELVLTPWRGVVVPGLPAEAADASAERLMDNGFVLDPDSAWHRVTACVGAPGCSCAAGETMPVAQQIVAGCSAADTGDGRVHVVGCERACGAPATEHELVLVEDEA